MSGTHDQRHRHEEDGINAESMKPPRHDSFTPHGAEDAESWEEGDDHSKFTNNYAKEESIRVTGTAEATDKETSTTNEPPKQEEQSQQEQAPASEPNQEATGYFPRMMVHLKRVIQWRLTVIQPTPKETQVLDNSEVSNEKLRSYLVWRRSMFLVSLPAILFSAVLAWIGSTENSSTQDIFNGFGDLLNFIPSLASTVLCLFVAVVLCRWSHWRQSAYIFRIGWTITFILPFLPGIFPVSFLLESCDTIYGGYCNQQEYDRWVTAIELSSAIQYAVELFPILITFPGGLTRASLKTRGLLPESTLSSWILVITAPFQSVIFLMALVILIQVAGNVSLFIATLLLFFAPWIYVIRRKVYVGVPTEENEKKLDRTQLVIGICVKLGLILFLIWAFTGDLAGAPILGSGDHATQNYDGSYTLHYFISYGTLVRIVLESIGRVLTTTVLFADALFRMAITNWRQNHSRRQADEGKSINDMFRSIEFSISSAKSREARSLNSDSNGTASNDTGDSNGTATSPDDV